MYDLLIFSDVCLKIFDIIKVKVFTERFHWCGIIYREPMFGSAVDGVKKQEININGYKKR